ncbi:MAG: hypothetical protein EXR74_10045 [Bdellovibrionales bacterium]|nr:hypothetical protein [Bdellovibrionales bacterium]
MEKRILNPLLNKITEDERTSAIAETSQMLAHDIRKPLQSIRMALRTLVQSKNLTVRETGEPSPSMSRAASVPSMPC